jgi:hypothetical protein
MLFVCALLSESNHAVLAKNETGAEEPKIIAVILMLSPIIFEVRQRLVLGFYSLLRQDDALAYQHPVAAPVHSYRFRQDHATQSLALGHTEIPSRFAFASSDAPPNLTRSVHAPGSATLFVTSFVVTSKVSQIVIAHAAYLGGCRAPIVSPCRRITRIDYVDDQQWVHGRRTLESGVRWVIPEVEERTGAGAVGSDIGLRAAHNNCYVQGMYNWAVLLATSAQ